MGTHLVEIKFDEILEDNPIKRAIHFEIGDRRLWLPRDQVYYLDGNDKIFYLPWWLVEKEGLEMYEVD